jgi:plastocyanin
MPDDLRPVEPSDSAQPDARRFSRRGFLLGLAAAGGTVAVIALGRTTSGYSASSIDPAASPAASPATSPVASPPAGSPVTISNFSFVPAVLHVSIGSEVTWVNTDRVAHTVTSDDQTSFGSPLLHANDHFGFRFT